MLSIGKPVSKSTGCKCKICMFGCFLLNEVKTARPIWHKAT